jgi:3-hydroxybutyryl-CoA dehydrogenase
VEDRVLVVGAGTMGAGIAFVAAHGGCDVELVEPDSNARERALIQIRSDAERARDSGAAARVRMHETMPERSDAFIAIEAVPEDLALKRATFAQLERALDPGALLATNTSSLSVAEIAAGIAQPNRVIGLHFFNPVAAMKLVEIVHTAESSADAIQQARAFAERCGKTTVLASDTPGFIVNRVARPYYLQAMRALEREVAALDELDALARGAGFRMGPFELMDLIGLDVNLATSQSIYERTGAERLAPVGLQRELVAAGRLGRKTKFGFYDYRDGPPQRIELEAGLIHDEVNQDERIAIVGIGGFADELMECLQQRFAHVAQIASDELLDELSEKTTIVIDVGNGVSDRTQIVRELDSLLPPETVLFVDAYATDLTRCAAALAHPQRLVGYGVLGSLERQRAVEVADTEATGDDALALAQELFEAIGSRVILVDDAPGLFLGRVVGSIVNEAVVAVHEEVASGDDVDLAMRLGTNYPIGPIAWGREIGGARIARILSRVAEAEGRAFEPNRSLWVLDVEPEESSPEESSVETESVVR